VVCGVNVGIGAKFEWRSPLLQVLKSRRIRPEAGLDGRTRTPELSVANWHNLLGILSFIHLVEALFSAPRGFTHEHLLQHLEPAQRRQLKRSGLIG
jgi:hypothetical protein